MLPDNCWNCRTTQQKFRCKGCGFSLYCSQICQKEHWKSLHGSHCKYLSGKKHLPGSAHSSDTCISCKKESVDYKQLSKKDSPGVACHIKMSDSDLQTFKKHFMINAKYNMNIQNAEKDKSTWTNVNFPFEFGEICGNYVDYFDKLLGFLQSILCHLMFRYPNRQKIVTLYFMVANFRTFHWSVSLQTGVTSERVAISLQYIQNLFSAKRIIELDRNLGNLESQHYGVTAWKSFMFLYEMLGVASLILPLLNSDIDSFDEEDIKLVRNHQVFTRTVRNKPHSIFIQPLHDQVAVFKEQLESLTIFDADFKIKPFQEIYEHFASPFEVPGQQTKNASTVRALPERCRSEKLSLCFPYDAILL